MPVYITLHWKSGYLYHGLSTNHGGWVTSYPLFSIVQSLAAKNYNHLINEKKIALTPQSTCFDFLNLHSKLLAFHHSRRAAETSAREGHRNTTFPFRSEMYGHLKQHTLKCCYKCPRIGCFLASRVFVFRGDALLRGWRAQCKIAGRCKIFWQIGQPRRRRRHGAPIHQPRIAKYCKALPEQAEKNYYSVLKLQSRVNRSPRDGRFAKSRKSQATRRNWKL